MVVCKYISSRLSLLHSQSATVIGDNHVFMTATVIIGILHMWQSRIEIEYYSVAYFKHITKFDVL